MPHYSSATVTPFAERVTRLIAASGADAAVAWRPLDATPDSGGQLLISPLTRFHAASTMKVAVLIELHRQAAEGVLRLDDTLTMARRFRSLAGGVPYDLSAHDDTERDLYGAIGRPVTLRALSEVMITASSNLATNNLVEALGVKNIQATLDRLGASGMQVLRGVEDQAAFDAGLNNTTDAAALLTLFWKLGRREVVSAEASAEMVDVLTRQRFHDAIPAGLAPGTVVAHKTGTLTRVHHDAGIVYGARPYALVVLTRGLDDHASSARLIAGISASAFNAGIER